jgi:SAM-dependent methyltransferase
MTGSAEQYIHGTEPSEQKRLDALNRRTNSAFLEFLGVVPGMRVLEVGSGLGILAGEVAAAAHGVRVVGLERSSEQLATAARTPAVVYIRGDAHHLSLADSSFDLVYARYVLEHVRAPEHVLSEMRRVARPGARVAVCENDVSLLRFDPPCPVFDIVWAAFQEYQERLGADGRIGRRLYRLFRGAGLSKIELSVQPEVHWQGSAGFGWWVQNIIGNVESARRGLIESRLVSQAQVDTAVSELSDLAGHRDASSVFVWNRAAGVR